MIFSRNLRLIRRLSGATQEDFSRQLDISRGQYQTYEQGRVEPPLDLLIHLETETHIPIFDMLTRELSEKEIVAKRPMPETAVIRGYGLSKLTVNEDLINDNKGSYKSSTLYNYNELVEEVKHLRQEIEALKKQLK